MVRVVELSRRMTSSDSGPRRFIAGGSAEQFMLHDLIGCRLKSQDHCQFRVAEVADDTRIVDCEPRDCRRSSREVFEQCRWIGRLVSSVKQCKEARSVTRVVW